MMHDFDKRRPPPLPQGVLRDVAAPDGVLPRPGEVVGTKYKIERLLGRGGMGAVFEASHVLSGKRVAVKWMLPSARDAGLAERFLHEARATARIDHPNVVDIYDIGRKDDSAYLVMELLHGESLASRLERAPLSTRQAVAVLMPALRGVAAAHAQGVIHRDLKPDNIFLCTGPDGETRDCKVLDFGISKIAEDCELTQTLSGTVMGTPYYMSPEQIRGLSEVDHRGDVYAFGVILYEILAQCYPFDADTYNELVVKIATTEPAPLLSLKPELEPALAAIVMKAMARDRRDRFQSVAALAEALQPFADGVRFRVSLVPPVQALRFNSTQPVETVRRVETQRPGLFDGLAARLMLFASLGLLCGSAALIWSGPQLLSGAGQGAGRGSARSQTARTFVAQMADARPAARGAKRAAAAAEIGGPEAWAPNALVPQPGSDTRGTVPRVAGLARNGRHRLRVPPVRAPHPEARPVTGHAVAGPQAAQVLPPDWDERLQLGSVPLHRAPANVEDRGAGKLSAGDL